MEISQNNRPAANPHLKDAKGRENLAMNNRGTSATHAASDPFIGGKAEAMSKPEQIAAQERQSIENIRSLCI